MLNFSILVLFYFYFYLYFTGPRNVTNGGRKIKQKIQCFSFKLRKIWCNHIKSCGRLFEKFRNVKYYKFIEAWSWLVLGFVLQQPVDCQILFPCRSFFNTIIYSTTIQCLYSSVYFEFLFFHLTLMAFRFHLL